MTDFLKNKIESLEAEMETILDNIRDRSERIGRGETDYDDCFLSSRMNSLQINELRTRIDILKNGGTRPAPCIIDLATDEIVSKKLVNGQYGRCFLVDEKYRDKFGTFVGLAKRESTYTKKGLRLAETEVPCWTKIEAGGGSGLMGAYTSQVVIYDTNYNYATGERVA